MVADHPLLSSAGTDNEAQGEVTERTDSHFPLRHDIQQKKSIKGKLCGLSTALDTLFLMALIINKGKWLLVAFLPLWYNGRRYHPYTGTERGCATMSIFSSFLLSVLASVVAYYICKWLDGDK